MTTSVRQETEGWVEPLGRIGLTTQGVLYAIVALLALQVASGHAEDHADQRGAIEAVAGQSFGRLLLLALTIGLTLHCAWRVLLAVRGVPGDEDAKSWVSRVGHGGRALIYAAFTITSVRVLLDADRGSGGEPQKAASSALDWPLGPLLLTVLGVAIVGAGLWHTSKMVTRSFAEDLDLDGRSSVVRRAVLVLGSVGYAARGIVFMLVGWFLVQAAIDHDPNESGGLDHALKKLANADYGPGLLRVLAVGLFTFGVYRVVDGWVRKRAALANA